MGWHRAGSDGDCYFQLPFYEIIDPAANSGPFSPPLTLTGL